MSWKYTDEYYKQYTRDTWNESAPEYAPLLRNLDKFNDDLLAHAQPRAGLRVLDIATGPGEPAMTLSRIVGERGSVLGIDLAERMIELARSNAKAASLKNVEFRVMDAENLDLPDGSFDLVTCRFGLQIVTDPERTLGEVRRVLKPGGRLAATVWGPGERCPAIHVMVGPMLEHAEPDETGYLPTPYEMGGPGELVALLEKHGFREARETRVTHDWTFPSLDAWLHAALKGTPLGHSLSEEDEHVQRDVLAKTRANMERYVQPDGSAAAAAECVVVSGVK